MNAAQRWKILACLVIVALSSGFIGATLALRWAREEKQPAPMKVTAAPSAESLYVSHLKSYLVLSDDQARAVQTSLDRARAHANMGGNGSLRVAAEARRRMQEEIRAVLTAEQVVKFNRLDQLRSRTARGVREAPPAASAKEQAK